MSLGDIFNFLFYQPILNLLAICHIFLPGQDLIWSVILVTVIIKLITFPISLKATRTQETMSQIDTEMKEIRKKYKNDPAEQSQQIMALYKKHNVSPFSSLLYPLIQLPIIFAIFRVFNDLSVLSLSSHLYSFVPSLETAELTFLGNPDLTQPSIILAIIVAIVQYWQLKTAGSSDQKKSGFQKNMVYFLPAFAFIVLTRFTAVIGVYWLINTLFIIGQQYYLKKKNISCSAPPKQKK
jgi:YidC/Oxa1 family membrane protein insertase